MTINSNIKLLNTSFFTLCLYWSNSLAAAPVNWQLTFFDNSGQLVGNGQFSYDPEMTDCIALRNGGNCGSSPILYDAMEVHTKIDALSINVSNIDWGDRSSGNLWWSDPSIPVAPGWQSNLRSGISTHENQWLFASGDPSGQHQYFGSIDGGSMRPFTFEEALTLSNFSESSQTTWTGSWNEYEKTSNFIFDNNFMVFDMNSSHGSFTAELTNTSEVPIPSALVLFLSGFFFIGFKNKGSRAA